MEDRAVESTVYKTQWLATFRRGLGKLTIVYGESEDEAKRNALAYYRKNMTMVDMKPIDSVVERVEIIG